MFYSQYLKKGKGRRFCGCLFTVSLCRAGGLWACAAIFSFSFVQMYRKQLTPEQALQKLRHYCGYQERCHSEVKEKLYSLGVWKKDHDEIVSTLIEQGYLNEERFALSFASGKFRIKQWGKTKIKYELKQRQVSDYCIKQALTQINDEEYLSVLKKMAEEKYDSLKNEQYLIRKKKTIDYLLQRGFEMSLVNDAIKKEEKS